MLKRYEDLRIVSDTEENQRANREKNPKLVIDDMPGTSDSKNMPPRVLTEKEKKRLEMLKVSTREENIIKHYLTLVFKIFSILN